MRWRSAVFIIRKRRWRCIDLYKSNFSEQVLQSSIQIFQRNVLFRKLKIPTFHQTMRKKVVFCEKLIKNSQWNIWNLRLIRSINVGLVQFIEPLLGVLMNFLQLNWQNFHTSRMTGLTILFLIKLTDDLRKLLQKNLICTVRCSLTFSFEQWKVQVIISFLTKVIRKTATRLLIWNGH